eukprot:2124829-Amphidinium_carterae.1
MRPQQSLKQWVRPKQPAVAPETRKERLARQQVECLALSLIWPRPPPGRSCSGPPHWCRERLLKHPCGRK